ncbi:hypothetical protein DNHGIG_00800 [Collibacillus ludicampi]|uniref:Uncharacterized protein n=1 Tax=Collibacillus ludicampi TaxID=2771369 RepID=A0AAV4L9X4_9BACL|nr:hypothetical protein [Collibacillus ludicampi]GIM44531.1 hypothetical protein DNHGIG_00800 [Collibacillus ludicampi]
MRTKLWENYNLLFLFTNDPSLMQKIETEYPEFKEFALYKIKGLIRARQYIVPKHMKEIAEQLVNINVIQ